MYVSVFELYRIGPGPSSSYTTGPQRAALRFAHDLAADGLLPRVVRVEAELYGGLAFQGRDYASDKAIIAGLSGQVPEHCDAAVLDLCLARAQVDRTVTLGGAHVVRFDPARDLRMVVNRSLAQDGNAVRFLARDARGDVIGSRLYYSAGGGAVVAEGESGGGRWSPRVPYPFDSAATLMAACQAQGKRICDLVRANECALFSPGEMRSGLLLVAQAMRSAVERGLNSEGKLPSGQTRTAASWADASRAANALPRDMCAVYATAVGEENACGGRVVAAPSSGAAGPVAGLLQVWRDTAPLKQEEQTVDFLLAGAAIGAMLRAAGVQQVGCQGEIGVAAAMAAAGMASVQNGSNAQVLYAAERALEPHLGLPCDPTAGHIEHPCIERGAIAASRAYDAAMTATRLPSPRIGLDVLARSVISTGRTLATRGKSGSIGGLAVNVVEC